MEHNQLNIAKQIINNKIDLHGYIQEQDLIDYILKTIKANIFSFIKVKFKNNAVQITLKYNDELQEVLFNSYTEDAYLEFCQDVLKIDKNEKYNCSRSLNIEGVKTRVFALMPPLCKYPDITISTTKQPPAKLEKQTIPDNVFDEIVHDNFIIVGGSGSGKTYLMNYLLNRFIKENEQIALIQEFDELIAPNKFTSNIIVPPPKPGEESLLKFVTEQSNLMRLDAFYVGEVKGAEAWPMIVNMSSGTRGGCTLHGESAVKALNRLRALCQLAYPNKEVIDEFIAKTIKYVIVMKNKNIQAIYRLTGTHVKNSFSIEEIYS